MKKISTNWIFFYKWVFPAIWFGFLIFFIFKAVSDVENFEIIFVIVPGIMFVFGFIFFKQFLWDLVDGAWDCGDFIRVKKGKVEENIYLSNIINVSYMVFNPPRATFTLREPGVLGKEVTFSPIQPISFLTMFRKNPIIQDLIERIDYARKS